MKDVRMRHGPHGHEASVTPSSVSEALFVDEKLVGYVVDTTNDIQKIAVAKILDVCGGKRLALTETSSGVWKKYEISLARQQQRIEKMLGPRRCHSGGRATVHCNHHGIFAIRIVILGKNQPSLHGKIVAFPPQTRKFAPQWLDSIVDVSHLLPGTRRSSPHFRGLTERATNRSGNLSISGPSQTPDPHRRRKKILRGPKVMPGAVQRQGRRHVLVGGNLHKQQLAC